MSAAALSNAGHRLYSAADVQGLALLKQLTDVGHAIGTLAALDMGQLRDVAATHAGARAGRAPTRTWRVVVFGAEPWTEAAAAGGRAPARPAARRRRRIPDARRGRRGVRGRDCRRLLLHAPIRREGDLGALQAAAASLGTRRVSVLHGYATTAACEAFDRAGVSLLRQPQDDRALAAWLQSHARRRRCDAPDAH